MEPHDKNQAGDRPSDGEKSRLAAGHLLDPSDEFQGSTYKPKPLNAWEKYVQVLLLSNELAYVD